MEVLIGILGIVITLGSIVFVHELGHYLVAKLSKMGVHEFSIGFGPPLISWVRKETRYSLRAVPLGGYVRIAGMEPGEENEANGFYTKGFFAKFATILAGATMNFILALVVFIVIGLAIGYHVPGKRAVIENVIAKTPAEAAGLRKDDVLVEINGVKNPDAKKAAETLHDSTGQVSLVVEREGKQFPLRIAPIEQKTHELKGIDIVETRYKAIGVQLYWELTRQSPRQSIVKGGESLFYTLRFALANIRYIGSGKAKITDIGGPVMVMRASYEVSKDALSSKENFANFLNRLALFSVLIGFFNILPVPALDGGHLATIATEAVYKRITKKDFDRNKVAIVHAVGLIILLAFIVVISIKDVGQWIGVFKTP
jgi:regulator of sigma E protease